MLPMVACTTLGLNASAVSLLQKISVMPNQSAIRMMVPRFPGFCTPSSANDNFPIGTTQLSVSFQSGMLKTASTSCGVCRKLTLRNSSAETSIISAPWHSLSLHDIHSCVATMSLALITRSKSPTTFGPSATKTLSANRFFFSSSERMYFILALDIIN